MTDQLPVSYKNDMRYRRTDPSVEGCTICPGVFDGISTHIANNAGFHALYLAGSGTSGSMIGEPDLSIITADELANAARMMVGVSNVPIVADADTGFGGPLNVARTIALYESAGVAGCHIEDQTFRTSVNRPSWNFLLERIVAAVKARRNPDFVIIARTDARNATTFGGENAGEEAFLHRLKAALAAGADVAFMESPRTKDECMRLVKTLHPHPVMINVLPNGLAGNYTTNDCTEISFKLAIYPCTGFIPA